MRVEPLYGQAAGVGKVNNRVLYCDDSLDSALPFSTPDYCTSHYVALDVRESVPVDSENSSSLLFDVACLCQVSDQNSLDFESYPTIFATPQASRIIPLTKLVFLRAISQIWRYHDGVQLDFQNEKCCATNPHTIWSSTFFNIVTGALSCR